MLWSANAIAAATGGSVAAPPAGDRVALDAASLTGVAIDSRRLRAGDLFVAIRAERDGHDYAAAAVDAGAGGLMVEAGRTLFGVEVLRRVAVIEVRDTSEALLAVGAAARARLRGQVVGITGSVGKTSTKDLAGAAVGASRLTAASQGSFNNELGVPLTLANAPGETEVAIIEMGARGRGHVAKLCRVAQPTLAVVTAVAPAHTEAFGDLETVAASKRELVEALPPSGTAVLNGDDERVAAMAGSTSAPVIRYSADARADADVVAEGIGLDPELRARFVARTPWGTTQVVLEARGAHQVGNALAALSVAGLCGVGIEDAAQALRGAGLSPWRMELHHTRTGALVLNDAYNANPASVAAALRAVVELPATRHVAVLGGMAELGPRSEAEHRAVAELAARLGVELIPVATEAYGVPPVGGIEDALEALGPLREGDAVLVKGSRVVGLERLAARLVAS
jgi:UDP-N-acetylmuramoyl-tripeptide--D-alanyl-D-alanine ligase